MADRVGMPVGLDLPRAPERLALEGEAPLGRGRRERLGEGLFDRGERDPVLRPLGAGQARHHAGQIERQPGGELGHGGGRRAKHPLFLHVALDERHLLGRPAGEPEVAERLVVDREEAHRGPVFRRHVGDGGPVGERHAIEARAEELHELPHHPRLPQDLRDGEHEVGRGRTRGQFTGELEAHDLREEQRQGLAEHHGLGLDAPHAPADHAQTVDHRGVAVGADERVGHGDGERPLAAGLAVVRIAEEDAAGEILEVDLVHDPDRRRHHAEVAEGLLAPPQEGVAFGIAGELDVDVLGQGVGRAEEVHLHGVVDDQIHRHERVDLGRVTAEPLHRRPHGGEIHHAGHAREVLEHDPRRLEGDLPLGGLGGVPGGQGPDVVFGHLVAVAGPQQRLEHHPQ